MLLPQLTTQNILALHTMPTLLALNPALGLPLIVQLLSATDGPGVKASFHRSDVLEVLRGLPPTLPSFDVMGRLLRDPTHVQAMEGEKLTLNGEERVIRTQMRTTVADLVRTEVLGAFVLNSIGWVERTEKEALQGLVSDDRAAKGVQNVR